MTTPWLAAQGQSPDWWLVAAYAHFSARLGAFFYWTRCFENNIPFGQYHSDVSDQSAVEFIRVGI